MRQHHGDGDDAAACRLADEILRWELRLGSDDLRSCAWYHGTIPRQRAEEQLLEDGDFLVRDCTSRPGNFVLSCRFSQRALHFVISRVTRHPGTVYETVEYTLGGGRESFGSVGALVTHYAGGGRAVSQGVRVGRPRNRSHPLSACADSRLRYDLYSVDGTSWGASPGYGLAEFAPPLGEGGAQAPPALPPRGRGSLPCPNGRGGAHTGSWRRERAVLPSPGRCASLDRLLLRGSSSPPPFSSSPSSSPCKEPSTPPSAGSDSGIGSSESTTDRPHPPPPAEGAGAPELPPPCSVVDPSSSSSSSSSSFPGGALAAPDRLLLDGIRSNLLRRAPRLLASHLTKVDADALHGCSGGPDALTLPEGSGARANLLERWECLRCFVATTVILGPADEERTLLVHKWIQVASELKTATGDLFAFSALVAGLNMPQTQQLSRTWQALRQHFTESACELESQLRRDSRDLDRGSYEYPPNTTVPHVAPFLRLYEQRGEDGELFPWELTSPGFGVDSVLRHLNRMRLHAQRWTAYRRNAEIVLEGAPLEDLVLDLFRTPFLLRLMWGARGDTDPPPKRRAEYERLLDELLSRLEDL